MAAPNAPLEGGGDKVLYLVHDVAGTNTAGFLRGIVPRTVNGTVLDYLGVASHADAQAFVAGDPVVLGGLWESGSPGTVRKAQGDATGRTVIRPLGVYNSAGTNAFGHPYLVGQATLNTEAVGWLGVATHKDGATFSQGNDGVAVLGGVVQSGNAVKDMGIDTAGRVPTYVGLIHIPGTNAGHKEIASTNTALAIAGSTAARKVRLKAHTTNAATIFVGGTGVANTVTGGGWPLAAGNELELDLGEAGNLSAVLINGTTGQGVAFLYWT